MGSGGKRDLLEACAWLQVAMQCGLPEGLWIAAVASREDLEGRLAPPLRDDVRVRATRIIAQLEARALPVERFERFDYNYVEVVCKWPGNDVHANTLGSRFRATSCACSMAGGAHAIICPSE